MVLMGPLIKQFSSGDLLRLHGRIPRDTFAHHRERLTWQEAGRALYLVAWHDDIVVGRKTLLWESKYSQVVQGHSSGCEVNALEAKPTGQGVGQALMQAAGCCSAWATPASPAVSSWSASAPARTARSPAHPICWPG